MPTPLRIDDIPLNTPLRGAIFSANGDIIMEKRQNFSSEHLEAFQAFNIVDVFTPESGEEDDDCRASLKFAEKHITDVNEQDVLGLEISDSRGRLLVQAGIVIQPEQRDQLLSQGVSLVHLKRKLDKDLEQRTFALCRQLRTIEEGGAMTGISKVIVEAKIDKKRIVEEFGKLDDQEIDTLSDEELDRDIELDEQIRNLVEPERLDTPPTADDIKRILSTRESLFNKAKVIFETIEERGTIETDKIETFITRSIRRLVGDRHHRLHIAYAQEQDHYLASHSLTTLVLSVNIAARLKYSIREILELCYGALLHDIGMLKIPASIKDKAEPLKTSEKREIQSHPAYGLQICRRLRGLPKSVPLVIFQENERAKGTGYPRGLKLNQIHPYARIVAVAASYDAMTRQRPHRAAKHPYIVMKELLEEVNKGNLDPRPVKALLETLSLFPIGSAVRLSDDSTGVVMDSSGIEYDRPVVKVDETDALTSRVTTRVVDLQSPHFKQTRIIDIVHDDDDSHTTTHVFIGT